MTEKELEAIDLALKVVGGDPEKATALLELLSIQPIKGTPIEGKLNIPDEDTDIIGDVEALGTLRLPEVNCLWYKYEEGDRCWVDMPDSKRTCKGKCIYFVKRGN